MSAPDKQGWHKATIYDFIANRMLELGEQSRTIEQLFEDAEKLGFMDVWDMDRRGLGNAMAVRGFIVRNGSVILPTEDNHFRPVITGYREFLDAVARIFKDADRPVDTLDLLERADITQAALPLGRLRPIMNKAGYYYIVGCGYWTAPQWTTPSGSIVSSRMKSARLSVLYDLFERDGWPLCAPEVEAQTKGVVTARWLALHSCRDDARIVGLGSSLYAPKDQQDEKPFPISKNMVKAVLSLGPTDVLTTAAHLRMFRMGLLLARHKMATIHKSRTSAEGVRIQTMRISLTPKGGRILGAKSIISQDAF